MTVEPNMFKQQALSGKAQLVPDAANAFFTMAIQALQGVSTAAGAATGIPAAAPPATNDPTGAMQFDILIPDAATATYNFVTRDAIEIYDVLCRKQGAGAGNTIQVFGAAAGVNAISDAMATAVDQTLTRPATINVANNQIAAGGTFSITATRAAGVMTCNVTVFCRRI